jgi:hypothetical protein
MYSQNLLVHAGLSTTSVCDLLNAGPARPLGGSRIPGVPGVEPHNAPTECRELERRVGSGAPPPRVDVWHNLALQRHARREELFPGLIAQLLDHHALEHIGKVAVLDGEWVDSVARGPEAWHCTLAVQRAADRAVFCRDLRAEAQVAPEADALVAAEFRVSVENLGVPEDQGTARHSESPLPSEQIQGVFFGRIESVLCLAHLASGVERVVERVELVEELLRVRARDTDELSGGEADLALQALFRAGRLLSGVAVPVQHGLLPLSGQEVDRAVDVAVYGRVAEQLSREVVDLPGPGAARSPMDYGTMAACTELRTLDEEGTTVQAFSGFPS